ncbi:hypothetical protein LPJ72_002966 [Coemansia sp. Benny D160-2]|nr:hypothetical protein LPJ72_002966 [Coemansia sp. Benny D160-2]
MLGLAKRAEEDEILPDGTHRHSTNVPDLQKQVYLWIGVVDIFLFSVSTCLFVYRGRRTLDINAHAVLLTSIGSVTIMVVNTCFLFQFVWPGKFPCFVILWAAYPGVMLWISCTMARAVRLYILSFRNMQKLKERNKAGQMTAAQLYGRGTLRNSDSDIDVGMDGVGGDCGVLRKAGGGLNALNHGFGPRAPQNEPRRPSVFARAYGVIRRWWERERMQLTERRLVWYTMGSTLFAAVVCAFIQGFTKDLGIVPMMYSKCPVGVWEYFPLYALIAFYCLVLTPFIVFHIWPIKDAFGIRHDILLNNLFTFVCIAMFMVQTNKGFGGQDPFWDSFLWCSLLFNMSQFTSIIIPLIRSYRHSDSFTWSDNSGRSASKELFYRVLNHPELFEKLKIYSAANFCTEITLFLEEYQVLKANTVRFYNMGEPGFDDDDDDDDDIVDNIVGESDSEEEINLGTVTANNQSNRWNDGAIAPLPVAYARDNITGSNGNTGGMYGSEIRNGNESGGRSSGTPVHGEEKDALRLHLNGGGGGKQIDLESNPDTIISVGDAGSIAEDAANYGDKATMMNRRMQKQSGGGSLGTAYQTQIPAAARLADKSGVAGVYSSGAGMSTVMPVPANSGSTKIGRLFGVFKGNRRNKSTGAATGAPGGDALTENNGEEGIGEQLHYHHRLDHSHPQTFNNTASLAIGGAAIGNLPVRRNSSGEDIMVLSRIPPFTPVRYTIISTLMQTPAGLTRQGNMNTFKTLPFALRGDYYGFYSTFIADGATLQINVEGRISEGITRLIHSQQYTVDMMDEAHSEVLQLLYDNIFKKFVRLYHRDMASVM